MLAVELLRVDPLVAIAPAGRPWRRRAPFTPAELSRHPLILYERGGTIRQVIDEWFRKAGATPRVAMELGNAEAIKKLVGAGLGLSLASAMAVAAEVKAGVLSAIPLSPPLARRLELGEGALGVLEQDLARARGGGALAHALHQGQAHLVLELTDVQAHGRLAQVQILGGAREAAAPHHFLQGADVRGVQVEQRRRHGRPEYSVGAPAPFVTGPGTLGRCLRSCTTCRPRPSRRSIASAFAPGRTRAWSTRGPSTPSRA